jgi:hypothetical protein
MALTALFGLGKEPTPPTVVTPTRPGPGREVKPAPGSEELSRRAEQKASVELAEDRKKRRGRAQTILTGARGQLASESNIKRPALGAPS